MSREQETTVAVWPQVESVPPDVPADALLVAPRIESFSWRVENVAREGGFALVTGAPGIGKSSVLRLLVERLGALREVKIGVMARPHMGVADFYRELGARLPATHDRDQLTVARQRSLHLAQRVRRTQPQRRQPISQVLELNRGDRRRDVVHGATLPKSAPGVDVARDIATKELGGFSCAFAKMKIGRGS